MSGRRNATGPEDLVLFRVRPEILTVLLLLLSTAGSHAQEGTVPAGDVSAKPRLTKPPRLLEFVEAPYPESEKAAGKQASVVLAIAIAADGTVSAAQVLESSGPAFDAAALEAVRNFVFEPAEIDGKPAAIRITYRYDFVLKEALPTTGTFAGEVRERGTGKPLSGVAVALDDGRSVATDENGRFEFVNVAPGARSVTLSGDRIKGLMTQEEVEAGQRVEAVYEIDFAPAQAAAEGEDADDLEIVVVAPALSKQSVSTKVDASQAKRVAGTQGDVLKIVENMPGVARAAAGSGEVVVWGAAPQDTRVYVEDVRVPLLYHFGGLRSVVSSDIVRSVELIPGGYGAAYGRGLGGLVTVELEEPERKKLRGSVALDVLDASASLGAPLSERTSLSIAARRSHVNTVVAAVADEDVDEYFPLPQYYDAQARLRHQLGSTSSVELGGLLSSDAITRSTTSPDPAERKGETEELYFDRLWLRYAWRSGSGEEVRVTPWFGRERSRVEARFGSTPTSLEARSTHFGLRASHRARVTEFLTTTAGFDFEGTTTSLTRSGSLSAPPREGDARVFGQPPSDQVNTSDWNTIQASAAPFVEGDFELLGHKLHVIPGARVSPYFAATDQRIPIDGTTPATGAYQGEVGFEPRLALRYEPTSRVAFKAAWGRYHQQTQPDELSPIFGNPLLGLTQATHWLAGSSVDIGKTLAAETTLFYSTSDDLPVRNPQPTPTLAQALVQDGEGRAYGAQFLLRRNLTDGMFGWVAYTILRSERKDSARGDYRLFDFDQTHVLTALASYELGAGFEIGARFRFATGYPRTPVVGAYYDARADLYQPILGAKNSERLPDFWQLDVRGSKRFRIGGSELEVYLDVQNVTHRENAEEVVYSQDYRQTRYILGLPLLPVFGARWEL